MIFRQKLRHVERSSARQMGVSVHLSIQNQESLPNSICCRISITINWKKVMPRQTMFYEEKQNVSSSWYGQLPNSICSEVLVAINWKKIAQYLMIFPQVKLSACVHESVPI